MELRQTTNGYIIANSSYQNGELLTTGTLEQIKQFVFNLLKTTPIPVLPIPVTEIENNFIEKDTVGLIEIEQGQVYKIIITYGMAFGVNTSKTAYKGGLMKVIEKAENLLT